MDPSSVTPAIVPAIRAGAPVVISIIVLLIFGIALVLVFTRGLPVGSESIVLMVTGALTSMTGTVLTYWMGSSASSRDKDATIAAAKTLAPAPSTAPTP